MAAQYGDQEYEYSSYGRKRRRVSYQILVPDNDDDNDEASVKDDWESKVGAKRPEPQGYKREASEVRSVTPAESEAATEQEVTTPARRMTANEFASTYQRYHVGSERDELLNRYELFQGMSIIYIHLVFDSANIDSEKLAELITAPTIGDAAHDLLCLVCYSNVDDGSPMKLCATCPRVFHASCVKPGAFSDIESVPSRSRHCPLCVKRTWDIRAPTLEKRYATVFDTEKTRAVLTRAYLNSPNLRHWTALRDDGSLESDHRLIKDMGMVDLAKWVDTEEEL